MTWTTSILDTLCLFHIGYILNSTRFSSNKLSGRSVFTTELTNINNMLNFMCEIQFMAIFESIWNWILCWDVSMTLKAMFYKNINDGKQCYDTKTQSSYLRYPLQWFWLWFFCWSQFYWESQWSYSELYWHYIFGVLYSGVLYLCIYDRRQRR